MGEKDTSIEANGPASESTVNGQEVKETEDIPLPKVHPIATAISSFLDNMRDLESLARIYVPLSHQRRLDKFNEIQTEIKNNIEYLESQDKATKILIMTKLLAAIVRYERLTASRAPQMLEASLFLGVFSAYDIFSGDLLTSIYEKKPELFEKVNRSVAVSEILKYDSFNDLKVSVLQGEIEAFRRKSYVEQFRELEATFGLKLTSFKRWPQFVECSQRRNLMTHCGGIVSDQYIKMCQTEGYVFEAPVKIGEKLELDSKYFLSACELMMEIGFMLGQTLWRKIFPDEMPTADGYMNKVIYEDCLKMERWDRAVIFAEFAVNQKHLSSDVNRKICIINYAIGLKFGQREEESQRVLAEVDWSGAAPDFKLAEAVLTDRYGEAAEVMERIGKKGELLHEPSYHEWPLFHEFRKTEEFLTAYEKIYGHPFAVQLQRAATKAQAGTEEELEKGRAETEQTMVDESIPEKIGQSEDEALTIDENNKTD